jgi:hypothetical protein
MKRKEGSSYYLLEWIHQLRFGVTAKIASPHQDLHIHRAFSIFDVTAARSTPWMCTVMW